MKRTIGLIGDSLTEGRPGVSFSRLLEEKYPSISFENHGKPGETIKSLHTRLSKTQIGNQYDLIFLWIGVNDVYSKLLKVQAQPIAENHEEFKEYFIKILDILNPSQTKIVIVSPAIVGENLKNPSNNELRELSSIIHSISNNYPSVSFLNLQSEFEKKLSSIPTSDYISTNVLNVMKDVFFYKNPSRIDRLSKKRGLHLTMDGIHLNSEGASIVSEQYASMIAQILFSDSSSLVK